jgi:hypothetical protein
VKAAFDPTRDRRAEDRLQMPIREARWRAKVGNDDGHELRYG